LKNEYSHEPVIELKGNGRNILNGGSLYGNVPPLTVRKALQPYRDLHGIIGKQGESEEPFLEIIKLERTLATLHKIALELRDV
jgi:hypothetical protein